ncbi:MarR family transcriptional regulator [Mucilaginibacter conchicola]|uniref:MarR family transcriptional regulator n=1 Tax=Mucilaginibacter conchicola TaxID=2303333 RepID=A0A372NUR6_9SPHI|nr:MarR family transcriptional regulator [Mucilaginibacter conchicola]
MNLSKAQAVVSRRFDKLNIYGIGFTEFIILYLLHESAEGKLRRIDLAESTGLTASGVTRLLLPMEKTGLVGREADKRDARVSYATLTDAGKQIFSNTKNAAENLAAEILPPDKLKKADQLIGLLAGL